MEFLFSSAHAYEYDWTVSAIYETTCYKYRCCCFYGNFRIYDNII